MIKFTLENLKVDAIIIIEQGRDRRKLHGKEDEQDSQGTRLRLDQ